MNIANVNLLLSIVFFDNEGGVVIFCRLYLAKYPEYNINSRAKANSLSN